MSPPLVCNRFQGIQRTGVSYNKQAFNLEYPKVVPWTSDISSWGAAQSW